MGKQIVNGIGILAGVLALILVLTYALGGINLITAPFRGHVEKEERVQSGDYRISAYDQFYDLCSSVQADEDRINNLEDELETAAEDRAAQVKTTITAVKNSRSGKIREYNADARKEGTRGQFRSSDLPYELDNDEETTCEA